MQKILIINTGGTFNKVYNPKDGLLQIDKTSDALQDIFSKWLCTLTVKNIINKDSLDMTNADRLELLKNIKQTKETHIIVIHGTDTIDKTADFLSTATLDKRIVLTGSMMPYSIDPVEATANLASAYGYIQALQESGVYVAMNGIIGTFDKVAKNRSQGKFVLSL